MKRIPRVVVVSPLIFLLVLFSWIIGQIQELFILFVVVSIHEAFHILAALLFKVKVDKVVMTPIGMMAKLNYTSPKKYYQEIIIAAAGPFSNLMMAILGWWINSQLLDKSEIVSFFILANISLLSLNILPVLPLDGGRIFKSVFLVNFGYKTTVKIFFVLSRIISLILVSLGIYQLFNLWYNTSLLFIGVFIYLWAYKEKDEFQYLLLRELIYKKQSLLENDTYHVEYIVSVGSKEVFEVVKEFYSNKYHVVKVLDENMGILGELTETEMLDCLTNLGYDITLGEALQYCRRS